MCKGSGCFAVEPVLVFISSPHERKRRTGGYEYRKHCFLTAVRIINHVQRHTLIMHVPPMWASEYGNAQCR